MTKKREWSEVDSYFAKTLIGSDPALEEALAANAAAGLPSIDVSATQGKLIHLLARMSGARKAWRLARSEDIRQSGWRALCPKTAGSSPWK